MTRERNIPWSQLTTREMRLRRQPEHTGGTMSTTTATGARTARATGTNALTMTARIGTRASRTRPRTTTPMTRIRPAMYAATSAPSRRLRLPSIPSDSMPTVAAAQWQMSPAFPAATPCPPAVLLNRKASNSRAGQPVPTVRLFPARPMKSAWILPSMQSGKLKSIPSS